ncbi:hypothetical protein GJAV_G00263570 [Gymnothorax javanicus]|nr:hypothetical protein GJAV_G00263570 [Gymnothorax javanicus]
MPSALKEEESTGWEEPSPESVRRKMEIDDGTSAWGDPNKYRYNNVNMWNKNVGGEQEAPMAAQTQPQPHPPQPVLPPNTVQSKDKTCNLGWGEPYGGGQKSDSSSWGEPAGPPVSVDNGTSAWGKPVDTGASWEDAGRPNANSGTWGSSTMGAQAQHKPGPKPMQDKWCAEETPMQGTRHSSWEEEEEVEIGMWNNNPSEEMNQQGNWSYMKKMPPKLVFLRGLPGNDLCDRLYWYVLPRSKGNKQDDAWMNQFVKQFNNMNFAREPEDAMKGSKMEMSSGMMTDKRMMVDKAALNMGEYNGVIGKGSGSRHQMSKESSMERSPYFDKNVNPMFGSSNAAAQGKSPQQPPAQPQIPSQPNLRAQVPPPLLSPQVPASLLKYPPSNGGLNPLFGPQQVAMLNQLSHLNQLNQLSQLQRLLLQQQKVQNQRNMPIGGRQQQEHQGRGLGSSQQMMQPPRHLDPSLLKQQSSPQPPPSLHQSGLKSYLENFMSPNAAELQKEQSALGSFSNFPLGGFAPPPSVGLRDSLLHQALKHPTTPAPHAPGYAPAGANPGHSFHSPPQSNGHAAPGSPIHPRAGRTFASHESSSVSARGLNSNLNVNMDIGSISYKEPQSRLKKWTALDISVNSPLDQNSSKPGAISSGLRLEDSPFGPYDFMNTSNSPVSPPGSVGDGWPNRAKSPHGSSNVNWPPEFRPGEPWKGYPNIDPETDPFVTPGSVINNLSINTVRDVDHLRDRNNGSTSSLNTTLPSNSAWSSIRASNYSGSLSSTAQSTSARNSDSKNAWSPGPVTNTSLAHELWKVPLPPKGITAPSRPPPGLTGQKPPSSWENSSLRLGGWGGTESRFTPGSSWGDNSSGRTTNWLVLKNLTPQIDGSTLRTLCMQHGPLITFHLNLPHGNAVVCYSSKEEAAKAQKSLHMCVLGNTTILAEFASEEEISRFFAQAVVIPASGTAPGCRRGRAVGTSMALLSGAPPIIPPACGGTPAAARAADSAAPPPSTPSSPLTT